MHQPVYCMVGGKSAGHILPARNIGYDRKQQEDAYIMYMSNATRLDWQLLAHTDCVDEHVAYQTEGAARNRIVRMVQQIFRCCITGIHSMHVLQRSYPDRVIATGGLLSVPVCIAAWLLHIPIELYECNARAGKAVYYLSYIADIVNVCFEMARTSLPDRACIRVVSYPLSPHMRVLPEYATARKQLGIEPETCVILVLGGSQGSWFINQLLTYTVDSLTRGTYTIYHQTGYHDCEQVQQQYDQHNVSAHAFSFRSDLHLLYRAADCCIARAGAGTLFELVACATPAYIIPLLQTVTGHQYDNALAMAQAYPEQFWFSQQHNVHAADVAAFIMQQYDRMPVHTPVLPGDDSRKLSDQLSH